ncbi:MerR family transcriptional regulator [Intrasporangium mesophilum]
MTTRATAADGPGAVERRLTIGKVLAALEADFPDVTASKIRFLEAEGLVHPHRTDAGYRTYAAEDVKRLRYILAAQRDRYWPLKVIKEALDALDRGLADSGNGGGLPKAPPMMVDRDLPTGADLLERRRVALTGPELRHATGIDRATFNALETFGLLQADATGHYGDESLAVAAAARTLGQYGLEPRHLRPFKTAADREIGLVEQVLATRRGGGTRDERAAEIVSACVALHVALVKAGLAR